jgi:hypothetical protein
VTTPIDEERVASVMREMLHSAGPPPLTAAALRHRATGRTLRRLDAKVVAVVAAVAAVIVALIIVGPLRSGPGPHRVTARPTTTTVPTSTTSSIPSTTTTTAVPAAAAPALDAYVAALAATDSAASRASQQPFPFVSVHSPPVADDGSTVAVAAFSYDPGGLPIRILRYQNGQWSQVTGLAAPSDQYGSTTTPSVAYLDPQTPSVADVTGDGRPDFLIFASAADTVPGFVVSEDGGRWRYIPFSGSTPGAPAVEVSGRDVRFQGTTVLTDNNNCIPDCAGGTVTPVVWTYDRASGEFTTAASASDSVIAGKATTTTTTTTARSTDFSTPPSGIQRVVMVTTTTTTPGRP